MKIRIGNDIRLKVRFIFKEAGLGDAINVQYVKAFFVNKSQGELIEQVNNRFINRFPIEPCLDEFEPSAYYINCSGNPKYNVTNRYVGFGINPDWDKITPPKQTLWPLQMGEVEHTKDADTIIVTFPAERLITTGVYKLIVVAKIYDSLYKNNIRTITRDYDNVFELVSDDSSDEDFDNSVQITLEDGSTHIDRNDVYIDSGSYVKDENILRLTRNDNEDINIDVSGMFDWYEPTQN